MIPPCNETERQQVHTNLERFIQLFKLYGLDTTGLNISRSVDHWCNLVGRIPEDVATDSDGTEYKKSRVITLTKYKTAAFVAAWTQNNLPPPPFDHPDIPHVLLGGRVYKFCIAYFFRSSRPKEDRLSLLQTILQSKSLMVRPDEEYVRYAEIKAYEKLTGEMVFKAEGLNPIQNDPVCGTSESQEQNVGPKTMVPVPQGQYREHITSCLKRTVRAIFNKSKYTDQHRLAYSLPSTNSNYNATRAEFGALGHLVPHARGLKLDGKKLIKFEEIERKSQDEEEKIEEEGFKKYKMNMNELTSAVYKFRKSVYEKALDTVPLAIPVGLSEPNKVRVITKGPPEIYFILKPLQKFMHNIMRKIPQLQLIGKEIDVKIVADMVVPAQGQWQYLSGDYSDATNEIQSWCTRVVTDEICDVLSLSPGERELCHKSLTEHYIQMSLPNGSRFKDEITEQQVLDAAGRGTSVAKQTNGQLMGSILSFLILCIENLTLMWMTDEEAQEVELTLEQVRCLVNGDDCLITTNGRGYMFWKLYGTEMGLKPSIGKVYFTNEFCTLNSRMFYLDDLDIWNEIPFVASSLLVGAQKSVRLSTSADKDPFFKIDTIGQNNYWLMYHCPVKMRQEVQHAFINNHAQILKSQRLEAIDWFAPTWCGGLGLADVHGETGWILNTSMFPGNPEPEFDDDGKPINDWKKYCDIRETSRKKTRAAIMNMVLNWNNRRFRPLPWSQAKSIIDLDFWSKAKTILPCLPIELREDITPTPPDNIADQMQSMAIMELYLTDKAVWDRLGGDYAGYINESFVPVRVDVEQKWNRTLEKFYNNNKVYKYNTVTGQWDLKVEGGKRKMEEYIDDELLQTTFKRVKYNSTIWKNNIQKGCSKTIEYSALEKRAYTSYIGGEVVGKGASGLKQMEDFDYLWPVGTYYTKQATETIDIW